MGLNITYVNRFNGDTEQGYAYAAATYFDWSGMIASIRYYIYPSYEAAQAGRPPIDQVVFDLPRLPPANPADCPSLAELIAINSAAYDNLAVAVDNFALTRPIFAGGSIRT